MCLLIFHLVLSGITFNGVDVNMAQKVLDWNLQRYPNGMLFVSEPPRSVIDFASQAYFSCSPRAG